MARAAAYLFFAKHHTKHLIMVYNTLISFSKSFISRRIIWFIFILFGCKTLCAQEINPFARASTDFNIWGPRLVNDNIMPGAGDIAQFRAQIDELFIGKSEYVNPEFPRLQLIRQDFVNLEFNQSCLQTPLKIGSRSFEKGLGTHANSEILISFPEPVVKFSAMVGIDNSSATAGRGSVRFIVLDSNGELFRSPVLRGYDEPFIIDLTLPEGTTKLRLIVDDADDGPGWDQANWCNPVAVGQSGKNYDLANIQELAYKEPFPFSFKYGDDFSHDFLPSWEFEKKEINSLNTVYSWTEPLSGLKVEVDVRWFEKFAAADWVLNFTNTGDHNSLVIENVKTIAFAADMGVVNTINGDSNSDQSYLPAKYPLKTGERKRFTTWGGRSSNGVFPFWNIQKSEHSDDEQSEGLFFAIGWTGQWVADFVKYDTDLLITAGMENISTILYPGESIRQPRVLVMYWRSNRIDAQALFRRLLMFEYVPKPNHDLPVQMPVAGQCFDRYWWSGHEWGTYKGQVTWANILQQGGFTHHWLDAGWFQDGWWQGAGNWYPDKQRFPQGMAPLAKVIHDLGMKFILWIEPERALLNSQFYKDYPDYFFPSLGQMFINIETTLFKLNDPKARKFLTEFLHDWINSNGVDVLRIDFNIEPLSYWIANDTEERRGMTEIRYVEGHYEMWNQLIKDNPGLFIDNCASGGRRIDLETTAISVPLWSSDAGCHPDTPVEWQQTATMGMAQYLPLFSSGVWESDPYSFRSFANPGAVASFNFMDGTYDHNRAKAACSEAKVYQKFWYGDFYPLTEVKTGNNNMLAWQLHREDLNAGIVYIFRQDNCTDTRQKLNLHAIDSDAIYEVSVKRDYSEGVVKTFSGKELMEMQIDMPQKRSAAVVEYRKTDGAGYAINVTNGTANVTHGFAGETITLTADVAPTGPKFKNWTSTPTVTFAKDTAEETTFEMPASAVTITAIFEPVKPTGNEDLCTFSGKAYPNPTTDKVTLKFETVGNYVVTVVDMSGKILLCQIVNDDVVHIDLSGYPAGVYPITIDNGKTKSLTKIVKK